MVSLDNYQVPNIPLNGWWQQWPDNKDIQSDNHTIHLDFNDREGKILIWRGDDWKPELDETSVVPMEQS